MLSGFITISILHLIALISPGPDFALVSKHAIFGSRSQATWAALGVSIGILVHMVYTLCGIAFIISQSPALYTIIRLIGAGYLIYLGITALRAPKADIIIAMPHEKINRHHWAAFKQGLLCNIFNPKVTLFFLSIFTVVVAPTTPLWIQIIYGAQMSLLTFLWFALVAFIMSHPQFKQLLIPVQHYVNRVMGFIFLGFAAYLVWDVTQIL